MKRTVSTPHLILGIIFAGIAALWMIGQATDAKLHDTAPGFPLVLIGAGVVGLIASLANARTRSRALDPVGDDAGSDRGPDDLATDDLATDDPAADDPAETGTEATTVITEENR